MARKRKGKKEQENDVVVDKEEGKKHSEIINEEEEFGEEDFGEEDFVDESQHDSEVDEFEPDDDDDVEFDEDTQQIFNSKKFRKEDVHLVLKRVCDILLKKDASQLPPTHKDLVTFLQTGDFRDVVKDKRKSTVHLLFRLEILEEVHRENENGEDQIENETDQEGEEESEEKEGEFVFHDQKIKTKPFEILLGSIPTDDSEALRNSVGKLVSLKEKNKFPKTMKQLENTLLACCSITLTIPPEEIMSRMLLEDMVEYVEDDKFLDENPDEEQVMAMQIRFDLDNLQSFGKKKDKPDYRAVIFTLMLLTILLPLILAQFA